MKKRNSILFIAAVFALAFVGCSHDELAGGDGTVKNDSKDAVYMNVTVQLPAGPGTRSVTGEDGGSDSGTEIGKDYENDVKSVMLVLAKTDNSFIGCAEKQEELAKGSSGTSVTTVQSISKSVLSAYYGDDGKLETSENEIHVFVFCNPTSELRRILEGVSKGDNTWYDQICTISETPEGTSDNAAIWGGNGHKGGFLMSSYEIAKKTLPVNFSDWDRFTTKENPFNLSGVNTGVSGGGSMSSEINNNGAIKVERSVARFDFKDGSPAGTAANTYNVIFDNGETPECLVQIELQRMALVNMSNSFHYLRRVSDNGLKTGENYALCGLEYDNGTKANYVVDTDADAKKSGTIAGNRYADHFNFCFGHSEGDSWTIDETARGQWYTSRISAVLDGEEDNDDKKDENGGWHENPAHNDYRIWRYVTENTIPGPTSNQTNSLTTGIVFKGKMIATDAAAGTALHDALNNNAENVLPTDPILYAYGSDIFVTWKEVRAMAIHLGEISPMYKAVFGTPKNVKPTAEKAAEGEDSPAVSAVYSDDETSADFLWDAWFNSEEKSEASLKAFKKASTGVGFTIYERSKDPDFGPGYYCYYYYWNRHNDNGNPSVMGDMEFAVVRNNVYKLAVTNISRLGHPRISENDPDPKDPDDPDEEGDVYLSVSVEVLPWVVRINDIEF